MSDRARTTDRVFGVAATAVLAVAIVAIPLPWGGVLPGGRLLIQTLAMLALASAAMIGSRPPLGRARLAWVPIVLLGALGALQLLPLPATLLGALSPASAEVYARSNEVLRLFGREAVVPRLSIAPTETVQAVLFILSCAGLFYAAAAISTRSTRRLLGALLLAASSAQIVWAISTQRDDDRVHGLFVNPNHLAGYLEIALAVAFGFVVESILTGRDRETAGGDPLDHLYRRWAPVAWRALLWGVIVIGILVTRSRGGIASAALVTIAMMVVALSTRHVQHHRAFALAGSGAIAAGVAVAFATTGTWPLLRFLTTDPRDAESDLRLTLWRLSIDAWHDFPIFGSGLGTFREAFRRVQPTGTNMLVEQAHSDSLQMLVTGGIVGLALATIGLVALAALLWRGAVFGRHREASAWSLAGLGALAALVAHGLAEFNFSIPAIPATLAIVTGLAWGGSRDELAYSEESENTSNENTSNAERRMQNGRM